MKKNIVVVSFLCLFDVFSSNVRLSSNPFGSNPTPLGSSGTSSVLLTTCGIDFDFTMSSISSSGNVSEFRSSMNNGSLNESISVRHPSSGTTTAGKTSSGTHSAYSAQCFTTPSGLHANTVSEMLALSGTTTDTKEFSGTSTADSRQCYMTSQVSPSGAENAPNSSTSIHRKKCKKKRRPIPSQRNGDENTVPSPTPSLDDGSN